MPTLRQRLSQPQTWLLGLLLSLAALTLDAARSPRDQLSVRLWSSGIEGYRKLARPLLRDHIRCRFQPSCSEYSLQAVQRFGIARGLLLTIDRLAQCSTAVPEGTVDAVPS